MTETRKVTDDIYEIDLSGDGEPYRVFLFDREEPTLIDSGSAGTADALCAELDRIDIQPEHLIITHADFDHIGGFDSIVEEYDPETYVPKESTPDTQFNPDHRFSHEDTVLDFVAVHAPGHKEDNYALVDEDNDVAVLGDVLIGADRRGMPEGYFVLTEAIYSDDLIAAERNLERLLEYEFDIGLVSHGSSVHKDARDKIESYVEFPAKPEWSNKTDS
jgi:glyoxylase-like metal-dependent hydrolase (beta-lactamase superfamily II)